MLGPSVTPVAYGMRRSESLAAPSHLVFVFVVKVVGVAGTHRDVDLTGRVVSLIGVGRASDFHGNGLVRIGEHQTVVVIGRPGVSLVQRLHRFAHLHIK